MTNISHPRPRPRITLKDFDSKSIKMLWCQTSKKIFWATKKNIIDAPLLILAL